MIKQDIGSGMFKGEHALGADFSALAKASFLRYSTRKFDNRKIIDSDKAMIDDFTSKINGFEDGVRTFAVYDIADDLFESLGYTKLSAVPAFLAIYVDKSKHADVKAGFYGEAMCLKLTDMGIKTCWVSGSIKRKSVGRYIKVPTGMRFLTSIAFGYSEDKTREAITKRRNRKPMEKIFDGELTENGLKEVMACVLNAPSAINRQPWRYSIKNGQLIVKKPLIPGGPYPEALDIGISMLHASCAAKGIDQNGVWRTDRNALAMFY